MAAAALRRSRGVTPFRTTKDLLIMFTLLCLVCLSSSLRNKTQLLQKVLEENYEKAQEELDELKESKSFLLKTFALVDEWLTVIDPVIAVMKKADALFGQTYFSKSLDMEDAKIYLAEAWVDLAIADEELDEKITHKENELRQLKTLIEYLKEQQAEL